MNKTGGDSPDYILIGGLILFIVLGLLSCMFLGAAAFADKTHMTDDQQLMGEIQATTASMINEARDREMQGAVELAQAVRTDNKPVTAVNDLIPVLALVGVIMFMGLILFALVKKG